MEGPHANTGQAPGPVQVTLQQVATIIEATCRSLQPGNGNTESAAPSEGTAVVSSGASPDGSQQPVDRLTSRLTIALRGAVLPEPPAPTQGTAVGAPQGVEPYGQQADNSAAGAGAAAQQPPATAMQTFMPELPAGDSDAAAAGPVGGTQSADQQQQPAPTAPAAVVAVCTVGAQVQRVLGRSRAAAAAAAAEELLPADAGVDADGRPAATASALTLDWYAQAAVMCTDATHIGTATDYRPAGQRAPADRVSRLYLFRDGTPDVLSQTNERGIKRAPWSTYGMNVLDVTCSEAGQGVLVYRNTEDGGSAACKWGMHFIVVSVFMDWRPIEALQARLSLQGDDRRLPKHLTQLGSTLETQMVQSAVAGALAEAKAQLDSDQAGSFMVGRLEMRLNAAVPAVVEALAKIISNANNPNLKTYCCTVLDSQLATLPDALYERFHDNINRHLDEAAANKACRKRKAAPAGQGPPPGEGHAAAAVAAAAPAADGAEDAIEDSQVDFDDDGSGEQQDAATREPRYGRSFDADGMAADSLYGDAARSSGDDSGGTGLQDHLPTTAAPAAVALAAAAQPKARARDALAIVGGMYGVKPLNVKPVAGLDDIDDDWF